MGSDSQGNLGWYDRIPTMTAKCHLMIDFHGSTIPHGIPTHLAADHVLRSRPR